MFYLIARSLLGGVGGGGNFMDAHQFGVVFGGRWLTDLHFISDGNIKGGQMRTLFLLLT